MAAHPISRTGFALAIVVAFVASLLAAGAGCDESDGDATCQTAMTASFEACGGAGETVDEWIDACETDRDGYSTDCAVEFQSMLDCQATTSEADCALRCLAEVEALAECGDPCTTCVVESCAEEIAACDANAECRAIIECIAACEGDDPCVTACVQSHPDGAAEIQARALCQRDLCSDACA